MNNLLRLAILLGVVEALIEFKTYETTSDDVKTMVDLIRFYTKVQDFIKEGLKAGGGGGGKKKVDDDGTTSQAGSSDAGCSSTATGSGSGGGGVKVGGAASYSANKSNRYRDDDIACWG